MPPGKSCPICGRMFGTSSLEIHIPQCQKKTIAQWRNDPSTANRPIPPQLVNMGAQQLGQGASQMRSQPRALGGGGSNMSRVPQPSSLANKVGGDMPIPRAGGGGHQQMSAMAAGGGVPLNLVSCRYCSRNFSSDRIGKHEGVCIGSQASRAAFDTKKQRLSELQSEMGLPPPVRRRPGAVGGAGATARGRAPPVSGGRFTGGYTTSSSSSPSSYTPKRDWRAEHRAFQEAIRSAKRDAPPPSRSQAPPASYGGARAAPVGRNAGGGGGGGLRGASMPRGAAFANSRRSGPDYSGVRPMASSPGSGGGAPKQMSILPTNDTSADMFAALGRAPPTYGSYGPIGSRGSAAQRRGQQNNQSNGFW